jgi:hypothetical protein
MPNYQNMDACAKGQRYFCTATAAFSKLIVHVRLNPNIAHGTQAAESNKAIVSA